MLLTCMIETRVLHQAMLIRRFTYKNSDFFLYSMVTAELAVDKVGWTSESP